MNDLMHIHQLYTGRMMPVSPGNSLRAPSTRAPEGASFREILREKTLKFSHHAEMRLEQRGIHLRQEQLAKLEEAIDKAAAKGSRDSLVLMNDLAFIVNVKSRTVITALDGSSARDNVFTQIDSAVIV